MHLYKHIKGLFYTQQKYKLLFMILYNGLWYSVNYEQFDRVWCRPFWSHVQRRVQSKLWGFSFMRPRDRVMWRRMQRWLDGAQMWERYVFFTGETVIFFSKNYFALTFSFDFAIRFEKKKINVCVILFGILF